MATKAKPSTALAIKPSANVISLRAAIKDQLAGINSRITPPTGNTIRITQDKQFVLPDGKRTPGPLSLVVVDFTATNKYYETDFNDKNIVPPNCFAIGQQPLKLVPSKNAPEPQAVDCNVCPQNQFGSNPNGKGGKACDNRRALAVMPPDATAETPLWLLGVSAMGTKSFDAFVKYGADVLETIPADMVVTVGFDPSVAYARLIFSDPVINPNFETHYARVAEAAAMLTIEPDVSKFVAKPVGKKVVNARR